MLHKKYKISFTYEASLAESECRKVAVFLADFKSISKWDGFMVLNFSAFKMRKQQKTFFKR